VDLGLLASIGLCSVAGTCMGFGAGLVPGLHMNNIAAGLTAYSGATLAVFGLLGGISGSDDVSLLISCFISAALIGHLFAESVTSTYIGIPAGDVVSVLPAHRLARAGLGEIAVRASADGSLCGALIASILLFPMCVLMGRPLNLYNWLSHVMGFVMLFVSVVLLYTEGGGRPKGQRVAFVARASLMFLAAGTLGTVVLCTDYFACAIPDLPVCGREFVPRSSLLLPMFAGLYGIPGLLLGLRSEGVFDMKCNGSHTTFHTPTKRDILISVIGGSLVGWLPGMTSGSSATMCAPSVREFSEREGVEEATRFIWLYSSISSSGAVFALGALFMIMRARSGCMDAAQHFLGDRIRPDSVIQNLETLGVMLIAMLVAACLGHLMISLVNARIGKMRAKLCSSTLAIASLVFVSLLSLVLTGTRGCLVMITATCLGLLTPLSGVRRIQLMGCLLVPITLKFFGVM
jgi:putative membrane protein